MNPEPILYDLLRNPISLTALELILNTLVVGFTPASSIIRLAVLPFMIICVYFVLPLCLEATQRTLPAAFLAAHSISFLFQYIETVLLSRWDFATRGPSSSFVGKLPGVSDDRLPWGAKVWSRISFGLFAATSTRYAGTPYQIKGVPLFSTEDPTYIPSRFEFLRHKLLGMLLCYLVLDAFSHSARPELNTVLFSPEKIPLFTRSTSVEQIVTRFFSMLGFWVSLYCIIWFFMGLLGFVAVGSGLSEPKYWPPVFGSLREAYTVRRFWG